jgi:Pyruvate/2-oxoacid:ferredoxin oxidoreductase gamma subunit
MTPADLRQQRDQALACLLLAACTALAVFATALGVPERPAIEEARKAVALHERLLEESARAVQQNQKALDAARAAYEEALKAPRR